MRNCPNCGSPIEPYKCKCEYCGTWHFDFTAFDMSDDKPYYVKFRTPYGIITTLARPELQTIETSVDSRDITDGRGNVVYRMAVNKNCDLSVVFHAQIDSDGRLYVLETDNDNQMGDDMDKDIFIIFGDTPRSDGENIYGVFDNLKAAKEEKERLEETVGWTTFHIEEFWLRE